MRTIKMNNMGEVNDALFINVLDEPGAGGANHKYLVATKEGNIGEEDLDDVVASINFQKGGLKEVGVNGCTAEALLMILIDRFDCFLKGPFPSRETAIAKTKLEEALHWLIARTNERVARGVEGLQVK